MFETVPWIKLWSNGSYVQDDFPLFRWSYVAFVRICSEIYRFGIPNMWATAAREHILWLAVYSKVPNPDKSYIWKYECWTSRVLGPNARLQNPQFRKCWQFLWTYLALPSKSARCSISYHSMLRHRFCSCERYTSCSIIFRVFTLIFSI